MFQLVLCLFCLLVTHLKLTWQSQRHVDGSSGLKRAVLLREAAQVSYGNFVVDKFHRLQVSVGSSTNVMSYKECAMGCVNTPPCASFNVASSPGVDGKFRCELLNEDKYSSLNQLISSHEYHHFGIQTTCSSYPCKNNGKCVPNYGQNQYHCDCAPGYRGSHCEAENWKRLNNEPVCFGARGDSYGAFSVSQSGFILAFKLIHRSGSVSCSPQVPSSYWGCTHHSYGDRTLTTVITFHNRTALLLAEYKGEGSGCGYYSYKIDGVGVNAKELLFNNLPSPISVSIGQEFRIWFGGDLVDCGEYNNSGETCVDVYAWYA